MKVYIKLLLVIIVSLVALGLAYADDVTDSVNEALNQYNNGQYTGAVASLDYAAQLIRQKKGDQIASLLPKPMEGWEVIDSTSQSLGMAMFGGGVTAERQYRKGRSIVTISIMTDSPIIQSVMMMLSNPMLAGAGGAKLRKIGGQKAIVDYDPVAETGEIKIVITNKYFITVKGTGVKSEELIAYAGAIDFNKIMSLS